MKIKKFTVIVMAIVLCFAFTGCASSDTLKDGTYKSQYSAPDSHGWTDYVEITVSSGKITKVNYDALKDGLKKSEDKDYQTAMKDGGSKTWPSDFYPKLSSQLVDKQDIDKVDVVAGATTSSNDFKKLVKALSKNMSEGKTDEIVNVSR